jgi:hypothetical protein
MVMRGRGGLGGCGRGRGRPLTSFFLGAPDPVNEADAGSLTVRAAQWCFEPAHQKKKALVATGNSMLTIVHALLSDPEASYQDLGADYYEQRMQARRQARNHIRSLERLGYNVIIQAINPDTGDLPATAG